MYVFPKGMPLKSLVNIFPLTAWMTQNPWYSLNFTHLKIYKVKNYVKSYIRIYNQLSQTFYFF